MLRNFFLHLLFLIKLIVSINIITIKIIFWWSPAQVTTSCSCHPCASESCGWGIQILSFCLFLVKCTRNYSPTSFFLSEMTAHDKCRCPRYCSLLQSLHYVCCKCSSWAWLFADSTPLFGLYCCTPDQASSFMWDFTPLLQHKVHNKM